MATAKLGTLLIRTLAKPISNQIKQQAKQHGRFREVCVALAQRMYRTEVKLRTNILGEQPKHIRPLSEAKAIENGANALAEGFLFGVAAILIIGETWRSSRSQTKRRDSVNDQLEDLGESVQQLKQNFEGFTKAYEERLEEEAARYNQVVSVLETVLDVNMRLGLQQLDGTPLQLPRLQIASPDKKSQSDPRPQNDFAEKRDETAS